jgi:hypothetical protein
MKSIFLLFFLVATVSATWTPYEATLIVLNNTEIIRHYRFNLSSVKSNQYRDLIINCEGDCDYIPRIFQCSGTLNRQSCRIETPIGYELRSFYLQSVSNRFIFNYYLQKNLLVSSPNCNIDYCNWIEEKSLQTYGCAIGVALIGCLLVGFGFFRNRFYVNMILGVGLISILMTFAGFYHLGQSCLMYQYILE